MRLLLLALLLLTGCAEPAPPAAPDGPFELPVRSEADRLLRDARRAETDRPDDADALYGQVTDLRPLEPLAWAGRARLAAASGRSRDAGTWARRAMRYARATNDVFAIQEAESTLGLVLATGGRDQDARRALLGAMFTSDGSEMGCAYQGLGELFARLERVQPGAPSSPEATLAAFDAGTPGDVGAVEEGDTPAHRTARALLHLFDRRTDEAEALLPSLDPADADVLRGHLLVARKDHSAATEALTGALDRLDGHPRADLLRHLAWLGLGWAANNAGRYADADAWFDRLLADVPRHRLGLLGKANARSWLGDAEGSEALLRDVLADDPDNPYALAEIAGIQLDRGELDAAEATYKAAMEQTGDAYTCPWEGLGLVYLQRGQLDAAAEHLEQAIAINPDIEFRKYNALAKVMLSRGEEDRARELLRKSIANYPHDPEAARMLAELE